MGELWFKLFGISELAFFFVILPKSSIVVPIWKYIWPIKFFRVPRNTLGIRLSVFIKERRFVKAELPKVRFVDPWVSLREFYGVCEFNIIFIIILRWFCFLEGMDVWTYHTNVVLFVAWRLCTNQVMAPNTVSNHCIPFYHSACRKNKQNAFT